MQLINENRFFWKKKKKKILHKKYINILINFIDFLWENKIFFLTKLDRMSKFNKFETQKMQFAF